MKSRLLLPFVCLALLPNALHAQEQRELLERAMTNNWYLRAAQNDSIIASGRVRSVRDDSVRIGSTTLAIADFTALERRTKEGSGGVGAAIAAGGLFGFLFFTWSGLCEGDNCGTQRAMATVGGFVAGVALGGVFGELVSPGRHVWRTVWPTPN